MERTFTDIQAYTDGRLARATVQVKGRSIAIHPVAGWGLESRHNDIRNEYFLFPGFLDVHVHFREPGFSYKETLAGGCAAAAAGGYVGVCPMPNLNPVPDDMPHLQRELELIARDAKIQVLPYGAITRGQQGRELADLEAMAPYVAAFSDDGRGVQDEGLMRTAMTVAQRLGKLIVAHCEDNSLLHGGCIHDGSYAAAHGYVGISSESEWRQVERDLRLAAETGCGYHVCHVSTKESVALIRKAKAAGLNVTCETAPHYLLLTDEDLQEDGRFKMNPPLRSPADKEALIAGLLDGTIDMIATDHAPHSAEEKSRGLKDSAFGIVGLETAFPALYTGLVRSGVISLGLLLRLLHTNPLQRFGLGQPLLDNGPATFTVFDLADGYTVEPERFHGQGRATPFAGQPVWGRCLLTVNQGQVVYEYQPDKE